MLDETQRTPKHPMRPRPPVTAFEITELAVGLLHAADEMEAANRRGTAGAEDFATASENMTVAVMKLVGSTRRYLKEQSS